MALLPTSSRLSFWKGDALALMSEWMQGLVGHNSGIAPSLTHRSPEETLLAASNIDPRMVPKVPMSAEDIDVHTLNELGKLGLKRGKLITEHSHPELNQRWKWLCARAGIERVPQLILVESDRVNSSKISSGEVAVTTGLLKALDFRELSAVLGHELAHETETHTVSEQTRSGWWGALGAAAGFLVSQALGVGKWIGSWSNNSVLLRYAGESLFAYEGFYWGRLLGHKQFVSTNELEADRRGAIISGDPAGLASALRKVEASQAQERITWRERMEAGYPSFEGRIERLEKMAQEMPQVSESAPQHLHHAPPVHGRESEPKRQVSGITSTHRVTALDAPEIAAS